MSNPSCSKTVAIIEDDVGIRDSIAEVLQEEGYCVLAADHGRDALDLLSRQAGLPCVILLDLMMPVMDGWAFRDEQKRHPLLGSVPVIVMTADANAKDKALALGAQGHMSKPVDLEQLLQTVEKYC